MFQRTKISTAAVLAIGALVGSGALAQDSQRIEITGSSIKRIDAETALPVTIINREEIVRSGVTSVEQLLQQVSATSSSGSTQLSSGAGTSTYGLSDISLRGLGSERTLVLVNGRRVAAFAGGGGAAVNVNSIPLAAIERVEVLKDGASAVYGSDAVAGVINFILTKNFKGVELSGSTSQPTNSGGGDSNRISIVGGFGDINEDRFNVTLSASYEKDKELLAKDRSFAKTGNIDPYIVAGATGLGNIQGAWIPGTGSVAAGNWVPGKGAPGYSNSGTSAGFGNPLASAGRCGDIAMFNAGATSKGGGAEYCAFDSAQFVALVPDRELQTLSANVAFKLSQDHELFGDALYAKSTVTQVIQGSPVRTSFLTADALFDTQGVDRALLINPSNPNYQTAANYLNSVGQGALVGQPLGITSRVFDFGGRTSDDEAKQTRLVFGSRGLLFGQDYEVGYSFNKSETSGNLIAGYFSQVAYAKFIQGRNDWNPWALQQTTAFNDALKASGAEYIGPTLDATSESNVLDARISGEAFKLPGGVAYYAAGFQYRDESYETKPSAAYETGDIAGLGGAVPPVNAERKVTSVFGELVLPIVKTLEANLGLRYDNYDDVGSSTNYKASLRWIPTTWAVVRGSVGTGFRAPTLTDLFTPEALGTSEQFNDPATGATSIQVNSLTAGNPNLKAEESQQASLGFVFQPTDKISASIDWFRIKIDDAINAPSAQFIVSRFRAGDPAFANLVKLDANGDVEEINQTLANAGEAEVEGFDLDIRGRQPLGGGNLNFGLNGTYYTTYDQAVSKGGEISRKVGTLVDATGAPVVGAENGGVVLRWRHALTVGYTLSSWSIFGTQNYARGYEAGFRQVDGERNFMPSLTTYDLSVGYGGIKNLRLVAGFRNIFDETPGNVFTPVSNQFQAGYDANNYDPRGRTFFLTAGYKFF
jgi:iron complex outermembrane recepter protein